MQLNMLEAMNIYVNVVEQGSFIRAAEVLELHRPAVTRAVQNLEHDLGVKLLHRTTRQVSMTDEGEEFYQRCLSLLSELDDVRRLLKLVQAMKNWPRRWEVYAGCVSACWKVIQMKDTLRWARASEISAASRA